MAVGGRGRSTEAFAVLDQAPSADHDGVMGEVRGRWANLPPAQRERRLVQSAADRARDRGLAVRVQKTVLAALIPLTVGMMPRSTRRMACTNVRRPASLRPPHRQEHRDEVGESASEAEGRPRP